jgi:UDP-N-acetylglucosamine--N-acetylmuramyl-(pentapeptide) pyrophosphoryl-undecaprenol N-acetylglucosamine transferase
MSNYRFILSGGGTGGHIFPAIAIADELKKRYPSAEFLFVGAQGRMEMEKVPQAGYPIEGLWISGIQRKLSLDNLSFPFKLISSLRKSRAILKKFPANIAIGTGGYASGPLLYAAAQKGIPCLIQEQNSYPGITNKILASKASSICVAFENMERFFPAEKITLSGNPLRANLSSKLPSRSIALEKMGLDSQRKTLLILGGSLGARRINELIADIIPSLIDKNLNIIWQCGKLYYPSLSQKYNNLAPEHQLHAFINNMDEAFAAADLVISRAGANTLSELAALGKASILIPSPNVAEDHQTKNANYLVDRKAAILFKEEQDAQQLLSELHKLLSNAREIQELEDNIIKLALPHASTTIVDQIDKILQHAK